MYQIIYFVPETHLEATKTALFAAGAGQLGDYEHCCWQVLGQGQFRPLMGADPFLGRVGTLEVVAEYRVELVCADEYLAASIQSLRAAHPYEVPAISCWQLESL